MPWSTPSGLIKHDEDPFRLYEPGALMTSEPQAAAEEGPPPSVVVESPATPAPSEAPAESAPPFSSSPSLEDFVAEGAPAAAAPTPASDDDLSADEAAALTRGRPKWLVPAIASVVLIVIATGAWLFRSVPRHLTTPAKLTAVAAQPVNATRAGTVGPHAVEDGADVTKDQPLGALDDTASKKRLADIEKRRAAIERRRASLVSAADKKVKPVLKKAEAARKVYASAAAKLERAAALPPAKRRAAVAKAKKAEAAAKTKLKKAEAALEALTHEDEKAKLTAEVTALEAEAASLGEALATPPFTAPIAGHVTWLKAAGDAVEAGDAVAQVQPGEWRVHADARLTVPEGTSVEASVDVAGETLPLRDVRLTDGAIDGVVDSKKPLPADGTLEVSAGEQKAWEALGSE